jgi:hypothetical protein
MAKPHALSGLDGFGTVTTLAFFILVVQLLLRMVYLAGYTLRSKL